VSHLPDDGFLRDGTTGLLTGHLPSYLRADYRALTGDLLSLVLFPLRPVSTARVRPSSVYGTMGPVNRKPRNSAINNQNNIIIINTPNRNCPPPGSRWGQAPCGEYARNGAGGDLHTSHSGMSRAPRGLFLPGAAATRLRYSATKYNVAYECDPRGRSPIWSAGAAEKCAGLCRPRNPCLPRAADILPAGPHPPRRTACGVALLTISRPPQQRDSLKPRPMRECRAACYMAGLVGRSAGSGPQREAHMTTKELTKTLPPRLCSATPPHPPESPLWPG